MSRYPNNPDRDFCADASSPLDQPLSRLGIARTELDDFLDDPVIRHRIGELISQAICSTMKRSF